MLPCRIGMHEVGDILEEICEGHGTEERLQRAYELAEHVAEAPRCDLGRSAKSVVPQLLEQNRAAFEAAVAAGKPIARGTYARAVVAPCMAACPAGVDIPAYVEQRPAHRRGRAFVRGRAQALPHARYHRPRVRAPLRGRLPSRLGGRAGRHPHAQALRSRQ